MSDLIVVSFKGEDVADQVLNKLGQTEKEFLISLEALFVLLRNVNTDTVLPELKPFDGKILKTSLSNEQEQRLK